MYKEVTNQELVKASIANINFNKDTAVINLSGSWSWLTINEKLFNKQLLHINSVKLVSIDGLNIENIDTTGIYYVVKIIKYLEKHNIQLLEVRLNNEQLLLLTRIKTILDTKALKLPTNTSDGIFRTIGRSVIESWITTIELLSFFGLFCLNFIKILLHPKNLERGELIRTINDAGVKSIWVASLLSFLIGISLVYQMAPQFTTYGANIYIVNFLGISLLKEVSPLLTAIIIAGRTGSAITAEIGTRRIQEEIDALQTMGVSTIQRIVLPKVIGVMIAGPLITSIADIAGIVGGAITSNISLSVNYSLFFSRLENYVSGNNYTCGIIKSIAFAFIVVLVGCFYGLKVKGNANSIGEQTTRSVVMSIVLIVFFDAIFGIIFQVLGV